MAQALAVNQILKVAMRCTTPTQEAINTIYLKILSLTGTVVTDLDAATTIGNWVAPLYMALMPDEAEFSSVECTIVSPTPYVTQLYTGAAGAGNHSGSLMSTQTSVVVTKRTPFPGRANRGRMYLPFPPKESASVDGFVTVTYAALVGDFLIGMLALNILTNDAETGEATFSWVICGPDGSNPVLITDFTSFTKFGTQRRRGNYGKTNT